MLLIYGRLILDDPVRFLIVVGIAALSVVIAVTVHEFSHALVANSLGDPTARDQGRVSLNPLRHLDPGGSLLFLVAGFGWGKPVPVNQHRLAHGVTGMTLVAAAGPFSNLATAFLLAVPIKLGMVDLSAGGSQELLAEALWLTVRFNLLLAIFNLIPLAPLDGSRVLGGLIPREYIRSYDQFQRYGPVVLVGLIMLDFMLDFSILGAIIIPPVRFLTSLAMGG